ncbi:DUF2799 domain-containing protein [Brevundimonas sp. 2R-24]|uniref:DUF2799 domain-containing protein n=1 Tax=Peiella sedimenti TaxID=3061083 RepID=A0ABT8SLQ7_9CAUL|nr:DUF2799 domain-containing protein [Caulobacteraceae bacterium XZ-24]
MKRAVIIAAVAGAASVLMGSCATLSEEQCLVGDWYGIGVADGERGYQTSRLSEHVEACARHGVTPDTQAYLGGRERGLETYCTPGNGFRVGSSGGSYGGVCPAGLERDFVAAYSDGQIVWNAQVTLNNYRNDRSTAVARVQNLDSRISAEEARLGADGLTDDQKDAIRETIRDLRRERRRALDEVDRIDFLIRDAEIEVANLRDRLAPRWDY